MSFDLWFGQTNTKGHMKAGRLLLGLLQKHTEKSTRQSALYRKTFAFAAVKASVTFHISCYF